MLANISCARWLACLLVASVPTSACRSALETPPLVAAPLEAYFEVPYPPPAAFTELVPPRPAENAAWIDGGWVWLGKQYAWERGGWLVPPNSGAFAPWAVRYYANGRLFFTPGGWFRKDGTPLVAPTFLVSAAVPTNEMTSETQSPR